MRALLVAAAFLIAATVSGQPVFSLFQNARAIPGAQVGDLYCTSTTTGIIVPIHQGSSVDGDVLTRDDASTPCKIKWSPAGGGTTSPLTTKGDIWGFSTVDDRVPVGTNDYVLTADSSTALGVDWKPAPSARLEFSTTPANGVTSTFSFPVTVTSVLAVFVGGILQTPSDISISGGNIVLGANITPPPTGVEVAALYNGSIVGAGGTVTSVGATGPASFFSWGSPITTSGNLVATLDVQNANKVFAGPTTGSDATPTFRSLVPADVTPARGGTGSNNTATSGHYLKGDGTNFVTSTGLASGTGSCTNQVVVGLNSDAAPTCASVTVSMAGGLVDVQEFKTPGTATWTAPSGASTVRVECIGGGGPGGGGGVGVFNATAAVAGTAGGGGSYVVQWFKASEAGSSQTVTVGSGGTGGAGATNTTTATGSAGTGATNSSFGTLLVAYHGGAGHGASSQAGGGAGVVGAGVDAVSGGQGGAPASSGAAIAGQGAAGGTGSGANAEFGGASGGSALSAGGSSIHGGSGGGGGGQIGSTGTPAAALAGGKAGTYTAGGGGTAGSTGGTCTAGGNGTTGTVNGPGDGGGGGGGIDGGSGATACKGGNGGVGSGGGGGGGALYRSGSAVTGGAGGDGGRGECRVATW